MRSKEKLLEHCSTEAASQSSFTQVSYLPSPANTAHIQDGLLKTELVCVWWGGVVGDGVQETHVRFQKSLLQRGWVLEGPQRTKKQGERETEKGKKEGRNLHTNN